MSLLLGFLPVAAHRRTHQEQGFPQSCHLPVHSANRGHSGAATAAAGAGKSHFECPLSLVGRTGAKDAFVRANSHRQEG